MSAYNTVGNDIFETVKIQGAYYFVPGYQLRLGFTGRCICGVQVGMAKTPHRITLISTWLPHSVGTGTHIIISGCSSS